LILFYWKILRWNFRLIPESPPEMGRVHHPLGLSEGRERKKYGSMMHRRARILTSSRIASTDATWGAAGLRS
jgi:hypothetical protein